MSAAISQQLAPDFGEPWQNELGDFEIYPRTGGDATAYAEGAKTRDRVIACVNACALLLDGAKNHLTQAPAQQPAPFGVWQPIETAPGDGTRFLVHYRTVYDTPNGAIRAKTEIAWFKESRLYLSSSQGHEVCNYPNDGATHWMPLPPPPTEKNA